MFRPVSSKPDFVAQEHEILDQWRDRRTFARLRAQNAGGPKWSFLDGPITANNPMGVHHAWGRAYKDLYQRFHAMLGEDERYQNGFDCQGLWVEVNVERDLGFTSKRDIEAFGIAEFVTLCKQRVLTFAARQTEQSIRLGMWMDWNDPHELRRLGELLGADPSSIATIQGPNGPVTDTVEMLVGRLGMPDTGGSYFTFSNENNDLIWGFLAECHRRGWIYKGHDTMPWCARCGTGISQTEMNEGYQDRDDPGLTVRFPLVDRPGQSLLVWTTTPWTLTSNVAAAVGSALRYVRVRQGSDEFWLGKGTLKTALVGSFEVLEEVSGADMVGWRYAGPFDDLPAVQTAFAAGTTDAPDVPYEHRVVAWTEVGEDEGTGIVHVAPGCGAEDFQLGRSLGLPVVAPLDESGIFLDGFGSLSGRDVRDVAEPIIEHLKREGRFYRLETINHRYPHCWRCGTPLVFRLVDEWYISMGPLYDQPRETLTREQVDASLRYQIMDVVDQIRWIPDFGYERELDWLRNMHDWMISKKRYWGLALPIYDCASCGTVEVIGGREELKERAVEGWHGLRGPQPAPAVRGRGQDRLPRLRRAGRADQGRRQPVAGRRHRAVLDAPLPRGSGLLARVVPGRLHHRELPRTVPQLVLLDARDGHGPAPRAAVQDDLRLRDAVRRGRPADAQERRQRDRVRRGGRPDGRRRHALDVHQGTTRGEHPVRLARRGRGATRAARAVERVRLLHHLCPAGGLEPDRGGAAGRPSPGPRSLDPVARGRHGGDGRGAPARRRCRRRDAGAVRLSRWAVDLVPAHVAASLLAPGRSDRPGCRLRHPPRGARGERPDAGPDPAVPRRVAVRQPGRGRRARCARQRPPDALADGRAGGSPRRGARGLDGPRARRGRSRPHAARLGPPQDASAAGDRVDRDARPRRRHRGGPAPAHRERDQRQGGRRHRRRFRARRATRQAAPAPDRGAAGVSHPADHGRRAGRRVHDRGGRLGDAGRRQPGARRGGDPGDTAAWYGRRPSRRPGRRARHVAHAGAGGRGRCPRAGRAPSRTCAARRASSSTTGSSCGSTRCRPTSRRTCPRSPPTRSPRPGPASRRPDARRASVELDGGPVGIALRRRPGGR